MASAGSLGCSWGLTELGNILIMIETILSRRRMQLMKVLDRISVKLKSKEPTKLLVRKLNS